MYAMSVEENRMEGIRLIKTVLLMLFFVISFLFFLLCFVSFYHNIIHYYLRFSTKKQSKYFDQNDIGNN